MKTNKKGISLIVLAITIIVMIILATSIILSITSDNIVDNAKEATAANDLANAKQLVMVAEAEWEMEPDDRYESLKAYVESKLIDSGYTLNGGKGSIEITEDLEIYAYPTIPKGFVASKAEGESKVSKGLVIYEGTEEVTESNVTTARTTRNQYVWVPILSMDDFVRKEWGFGSTPIRYTISYDLDSAEEAAEYTAMKESVAKHGGFYIARYEAGKENNVVVSKKNATEWTQISWADAKIKAATKTTYTAVSHLIYGEEWDAALDFISKTDSTYATNSTGKGNYTRSLLTTGSSDDYAKNNIYDMAGNVWEWTMEARSSGNRVLRGSSFQNTGATHPASFRHHLNPDVSDEFFGFRITLYLK